LNSRKKQRNEDDEEEKSSIPLVHTGKTAREKNLERQLEESK
jgi:hypothetical protein